MLKSKIQQLPVQAEKTEVSVSPCSTGQFISSTSSRLETVDQVLSHANIDVDLWQVDRSKVKSFEKNTRGPGGSVLVVPLFQIEIWIKRRAPEVIQDGIRCLLKAWRPPKLPKKKFKRGNELVEVSLYDAHFGCVAFGSEKYSLKDARRVYVDSVQKLAQTIEDRPVDRIIFPVGNDFFHADNWRKETFKGTKLDHVDEGMDKVFSEGWRAVDEVITLLSDIAPVEVLWVPGNHDKTTSYYLVELLQARYEGSDQVSFDTHNNTRKYRVFGNNLFGYTHGDMVKPDKLPLLMAAEVPELWGKTKYRAWRCGHTHTKRQLSFYVGDTTHGVKVEVMPSLCPTNEWHHENGYVGNTRSAELWIWDQDTGYKGHFAETI